jgi:6-phosphogluconolactonase/glucosamine-6-phosphate isomerase/deaminase
MQMLKLASRSALEELVAKKLVEHLMNAPSGLHVLPTGSTYRGVYVRAISLLNEREVQSDLFRNLIIANLDEYVEKGRPLSSEDPRSFAAYMGPFTSVLMKWGFSPENHLFPHTPYREQLIRYMELTRFDDLLGQYECESVFLGLGPKDSPHIAFCGPGFSDHFRKPWEQLGSFVGPVDEATRTANEANPGMTSASLVPKWAVTMSPGTLLRLKPKHVYLVAYGPNKDLSVVDSTLPVSRNPASILKELERVGSAVGVITTDCE